VKAGSRSPENFFACVVREGGPVGCEGSQLRQDDSGEAPSMEDRSSEDAECSFSGD
jgi:hypothetical protein